MIRNSVLLSFDLPDEVYAPDVLAVKQGTIERFGIDEWRIITMTNEIHGHLGIYSTIGAKMGMLAKGILGNEGEPHVLSFAGSCPPVSCFNDGIQISTGSTVGHGLITLSDEEEKRIEAIFTLKGKSVRIALKHDYQARIRADIKYGVQQYAHTPPYWTYIRALAIKYWSEWDRNEIFEVRSFGSEK